MNKNFTNFSDNATAFVSESFVRKVSSSGSRSILSSTFLTASAPIPAVKASSPNSSWALSSASSEIS